MTRLQWGAVEDKKYEAGVDRGVFYFNAAGEAWNGLISVQESKTGGEVQEYYMDGMKYAETVSSSDYSAVLEALTSPEGFSLCEGRKEVYSGLFATNQKHLKFDLSYRTLIGNAVDGLDYGYKIHLVYNVIATSSGSTYSTVSDSIDPIVRSWELKTVPPYMDSYGMGIRPTAHLIVDSTMTDPVRLRTFEDYIYGDELNNARFPTLDVVRSIFNA